MMPDEFAIRYGRIQEENQIAFDGSVTAVKVVRFWIGKHGPFVERFTAEQFTPDELRGRAEALRRTLQNLPV
jgi:hypothetical protein